MLSNASNITAIEAKKLLAKIISMMTHEFLLMIFSYYQLIYFSP